MNKSKTKEARKIYTERYLKKPGVQEARNQLNREWIEKNRDRYNQAKSEYRFKLKVAAISQYSDGKMCCAHCEFSSNIDALCLDHIDDNGAEHRKSLGCSSRGSASGTTMYERLKALGWLPGLQVLCANCNTIKSINLRRGRDVNQMIEATSGKTRWRK